MTNMRKTFRHGGAIMLVAVFALGLLGAAYTLWFEDLTLHADVDTGTFNANLSVHDLDTTSPNAGTNMGLPVVALPVGAPLVGGVATYLDPDGTGRDFWNGAAGYGNFTNGNFPHGKPQPSCEASLVTDSNLGANDAGDWNSLTLSLGGLFPYAGCEFEVDITNSGSVPLHFGMTEAQLQECDAGFVNCQNINGNGAPWSTGLDPSMNSTQLAQCAGWFGHAFGKIRGPNTFNGAVNGTDTQGFVGFDPIGTWVDDTTEGPAIQLHANESMVCRLKIILDQNPNAEGKFYRYWATFRAHQWNETPATAP